MWANRIALMFMLMASTSILNAQTTMPTMKQLTPGNPDYVYAQRLLNTVWDQNGKFHYTMPEDTAKAEKVLPWRAPGSPDPEALKKVEEEWRKSLPEEEGIVYGKSVHRNEFGIDGGIFWNAKGNKMAFYRMDESMVQCYPLVQTNEREATVKWVRYPMLAADLVVTGSFQASGIEQMANETPATSVTYDIYGRQVSEPQPGTLYLSGNRKILVR